MADRVLTIGLDGGTWQVLDPLVQTGHMPNLARLLERSARGNLQSTIPPVTAAAWTSFATGKNPGKHGLVDFVYFPNHGYRVAIANSRTRAAKVIWDIVGESGKRVGIVSVPMTYPPEAINGVMITDLMTPNPTVEYTFPPELKGELLQRVGPFVITPGEGALPSQPASYLEKVRKDIIGSAKYALYLLQKEPYDLFMYVFGAVDILQHQFWHLLSGGPENDRRTDSEVRRQLVGIFEEIDNMLGELIQSSGDNTLVILMSDHGFGPIKNFLHINNWLLKHRYLVLKTGALSRLKQSLFSMGATPQNVHLALKALSLDLRRKFNRGRAYGMLRHFFLSFDDVDWNRTRAFALGHIGQIYINVKGRQPNGIVEHGPAYEALRNEIRANLLELTHPANGERLIREVLDREAIYHGDMLDQAPDLLLLPNDFKYVAFGESEFASNQIVGPTLGHTGHHRLEGIVAIAGPGIQPGSQLNNAQLIDLAPTILYALGLPIPPDMDGRVLTEAFETQAVTRAPSYQLAPQVGPQVQGGYSREEEEQVLQRLADLGYVS